MPGIHEAPFSLKRTGSRLASLTVVRFGMVSLVNEGLYFFLYWLVYRLTKDTVATLAIAGFICVVVNGYSHARVTFQVKFHWRLLVGYLQIQLFGFALSFLTGILAKRAGASEMLIAVLSYTFWALCSFFLSRRLFRSSPAHKRRLHALKGERKISSARLNK